MLEWCQHRREDNKANRHQQAASSGMQATVVSVCLHSPESLMSNQLTDLGQCIQHGLARRAVR